VGFGTTTSAAPVGIKRFGLAQLSSCMDANPGALCYGYVDPIGPPGQYSTGCGGDSGGPMFTASAGVPTLVGVTSGAVGVGAHDCTAPHQEQYTDVYTDRAWIQTQAGADLAQPACGGLPSAGTSLAPFAGGSGILSSANPSTSFTFEVPSGTLSLNVILNADVESTDFDLYIKSGSTATPNNFDCKSEFRGISIERCQVPSPTPGTWSLTANRFSGDGIFQMTATAFRSAAAPCVRDAATACLQNDRFEVKVSWNNNDGSGSGQVMSFGGQRAEGLESAFYFFQSPTNFEMGVKVLNACIPAFGDKFWVFISGLTDQGWQVTIRDTQTGAIKTYSNARGHLSTTFSDTAAFTCT